MTALLAIVVEGKVPSRFEAAALAVLCAGVMLTVWEGLAGSAAGILLCLAGTVRPSTPQTARSRGLGTYCAAPIKEEACCSVRGVLACYR